MLSKEQKEKLRNIHIYELACEEKNGIAIIRKSVTNFFAKKAKRRPLVLPIILEN